VLTGTPYSFRTRFESEKGTNPEELIAAAHAGCFMTLAFALQGAGYTPTELNVEAAVTVEPEGAGFRSSRSALALRPQVSNLDQAAFARMVSDAEKKSPVSKVLKCRDHSGRKVDLDLTSCESRVGRRAARKMTSGFIVKGGRS